MNNNQNLKQEGQIVYVPTPVSEKPADVEFHFVITEYHEDKNLKLLGRFVDDKWTTDGINIKTKYWLKPVPLSSIVPPLPVTEGEGLTKTSALLEKKLAYVRDKYDNSKTLFEQKIFEQWGKKIVDAIETINGIAGWKLEPLATPTQPQPVSDAPTFTVEQTELLRQTFEAGEDYGKDVAFHVFQGRAMPTRGFKSFLQSISTNKDTETNP